MARRIIFLVLIASFFLISKTIYAEDLSLALKAFSDVKASTLNVNLGVSQKEDSFQTTTEEYIPVHIIRDIKETKSFLLKHTQNINYYYQGLIFKSLVKSKYEVFEINERFFSLRNFDLFKSFIYLNYIQKNEKFSLTEIINSDQSYKYNMNVNTIFNSRHLFVAA